MNKLFKTVMLPISVPDNDYCWDSKVPCDHFNNEGGYSNCVLGFYDVERDKDGNYPKPKKCKELLS